MSVTQYTYLWKNRWCILILTTEVRVGFFVGVFVSVEVHKACVARKTWGFTVLAPFSIC